MKQKRLCKCLLVAHVLVLLIIRPFFCVAFANTNAAPPGERIYYVSPNGNDSNSGNSPATSWRTLQRVSQHQFKPSDKVLFKRDGEWKGHLLISARGTAKRPIVIGCFGNGAAPKIYNFYDFSSGLQRKRYSKEMKNRNLLTCSLPYKPSFIYDLRLVVKTEIEECISLQLSLNGSLFLQNEKNKRTLNKWQYHKAWFMAKKLFPGLEEIKFAFKAPPISMKVLQLTVQTTVRNSYVKLLSVRMAPKWTPDPIHNHVFMLDTGIKPTELIYNNIRLSRHNDISTLENLTYCVRNGIWYLKDMAGNPEDSEACIQAVTPNQNAVLFTKSDYVVLEGLNIRGGTGIEGNLGALGIYDSNHIEVRDSSISDSSNAAVMAFHSQHIKVLNCDVSHGGLGGIYFRYCSDSVISNNDIHDNGDCLQDINDLHGIGLYASKRITIECNHVHNNGYGGGTGNKGESAVTLYGSSNCSVRYNLIDHNWRGAITIDSGYGINSDRSIVRNNMIVENGLLGKGGRYPALAIQAHPPSRSDNILVENNTIFGQRTGDLWSIAAQKPDAVSDGDTFRSRNCRGKVIFWKGAYLIASLSGTLHKADVLESMDDRWKTPVLRINSAPAAIILMSPLAAVRSVSLRRNIVTGTHGTYDLSVGKNFLAHFAGNFFWEKRGAMIFREDGAVLSSSGENRRGLLLRDPRFRDISAPEGLVPENEDCRDAGAQPQLWLDKVRVQAAISSP